jgi:hypothetical protein
MIAQTLWVTTDRFEATTIGKNFINPRCFGQDFAEWLQACLAERDHKVCNPVQEDFGWVILAVVADRKFTISIGIMDESIGQVPAIWCVTVAYEKPLNSFWTWFKPAPMESFHWLFKEVHSTLESERDFKVSEEEPHI